MIDPCDVIKYDRTDNELEEFMLFCVLAANKPATRMAKALEYLLSFGDDWDAPLLIIRRMVFAGTLMQHLIEAQTGLYTSRSRALTDLCMNYTGMILRRASISELENIYGVGRKTARMFAMFTRPHANVAVLDTHILKYLRSIGVGDVPIATPSNEDTYERLSDAFIRDAALHGRTPAEHDLFIWSQFSKQLWRVNESGGISKAGVA